MLVSVAVINDDESLYLRNFFGTIENKWKDRLDFIFADNCSGDDSVEIARRHGVGKIIPFNMKQDSIAALYNAALERADGAYILFAHSDVIFSDGFFDRLLRRLLSDPPDVMNFQVYYVDKTTRAGNALFWNADRREIYNMQVWGALPEGECHRIVSCSDCCFMVKTGLARTAKFSERYRNNLFIHEFMLRLKPDAQAVFHESRASVEHYFIERHKQLGTRRDDEHVFIKNNISVLFQPEIVNMLHNRGSRIRELESALREGRSHHEQLSHAMQEIRGAVPALEKLLKRTYHEAVSPEMLIEAGELCFNFKSYDDARGFFERALRLDPENADALNNLGVLEIKKGDLESARSFFTKALSVSPDCEEAKMNLDALSRTGDVLNDSHAGLNVISGKDVT